MLVHQYLGDTARRLPDKIALVCGTTRLTYGELAHAAAGLTSHLLENGIRTGDRVVIHLENSPESVIAIYGTLAAGGCIVFVNATTPPERLGFILNNSGARILIAPSSRMEHIMRAEATCAVPPRRILTGAAVPPASDGNFDTICRQGPWKTAPPVIDLDLAAVIYTSGSTGIPKGVTLTHRNIDTVVASVSGYLGHSEEDVILAMLPLSFGYGLLQLWVTFRNGGTLLLEKGFGFPFDIVRRIAADGVTGFAGVPTVFALITQLAEPEKLDFRRLRYITNAAAALPPSFIPRLQKIFPTTRIFLMHGLTECLRTTYLPPEEVETRPTSVGRGMENVELWIENPEGQRLGPGETGELVVRGSNVMQGYWNDPEATATMLRPGRHSWERVLHTRDLFRLDEDGYFYFVSRTDDLIKCKGEKVSPLEIENLLYTLPQVLEVRVIGLPDNVLGNAIKAEIVLKEGHQLTANRVKAYCREHLEDVKVPHVIDFVPSLPKSAGGKIRRK